MLDIDRETVYCVSPEIIFKEIRGVGYWVFNLENGDHYSINVTTFRILQLIAEGRSMKSISDLLVSEYDVDAIRASKDLQNALDRLLKERIILKGELDETVEEKAL